VARGANQHVAYVEREMGLRQFVSADRDPDRGDGRRESGGRLWTHRLRVLRRDRAAVSVEPVQPAGRVAVLRRLHVGFSAAAVACVRRRRAGARDLRLRAPLAVTNTTSYVTCLPAADVT